MMKDRRLEELTEVCRHILRLAEVVAQKHGDSHKAFNQAYWELERVQDTCSALRCFEGYEIARYYQAAAWSQIHKGFKS